jgi:outer membrane receptor protein involved in Fe transport
MIAFIVALLLQAPVPDAGVVSGIVRDSNGGVVAGATVIVRSAAGGDRQALSGPDGRFNLPSSDTGEVVLIVRAAGFGEKRQSLPSGATRRDLEVVLSPATVFEAVTVTPTRGEQRMGDVPASISILGREEIKRSPAVVADDVLRQVPTFSLFRRTSSLSSHPTTQGVSLRGIGPSGVSRTLVLLDGVPFNDPFGGWVYWTRLPMERASRIEIVDGSSSSLYGNYAMGGVINVVTSSPERRTLALRTQYGNLNTPKLDVAASDVWGKLGVSVDAGMFSTDGFPVVVAVNPAGVPERGQVDNDVTVDFRNFNVKLDYDPTGRIHTFFRTGYFREERNNGKHSTIDQTPEANDTTWKTMSGGVRMRLPDASELQANVFLDFGDFHSSFLAVPASTPPRNVGRMTLNQAVPSTGVGWTAQWSRTFAGNQVFTAGADGRWVDGDSEEDGLDAQTGTTVTLRRVSGGTQRSFGAFLQDIYKPIADLTLTFSARVDSWRSYDGHNIEHNVPSGTPTDGNAPSLPDRSDTVVSPRAGALYRLTSRVNIWGDFAWGFRAPTLNELYRQFRVGQVLTLANYQLGPERLVGGEAGVSIAPLPNLTVRSTWYDNRVTDPVSNVTISTVGATVTQQRQNLGKTRVTGLQTDVEYRAGAFWRFAGGYLYNRARVTENPANAALVDKSLPQVPAHRGAVQVSYANPKYATVSFELLAIGRQFDDDQNVRAVPGYSYPGLPKYALIGINAERAISPRFEVFFGVQNLLDQAYFVGTLPTTTGSPRMVTGGIRVRLTGR